MPLTEPRPYSLDPSYSPLGCPFSDRALHRLPEDVRASFHKINEARRTGAPTLLEELKGELESRLATMPRIAPSSSHVVPAHLAVRAALGDAYSILGRWRGQAASLETGVAYLTEFVAEAAAISFEDNEETRARAHLCLGTALVRLGYLTRSAKVLESAASELNAKTSSVQRISHPPLHAAIHRDLGDAYVGQLFFDKSVLIDGGAFRALEAAERIFEEYIVEDAGACMFDELAATKSSLALARARVSSCLIRADRVHDRLLRGRTRESVAIHQREMARKLCQDLWASYLNFIRARAGLLSGQKVLVPFRWARTISNLGFAALELFRHDRDDLEMAEIAEAALRSVTQQTLKGRQRGFWIQAKRMASHRPAFDHGASYKPDDHPDRFEENDMGLEKLASLAG